MSFFNDMSYMFVHDGTMRAENTRPRNSQPSASADAAERLQGCGEIRPGTPAKTTPSSPSATDLFPVTTHTTVPWTPEQEPLLKRLGWRQRVKEFFRPDLRKKRALEEFEISQRLDVSTEEPVEAPRLPGLGLEKLNRIEEMDMVGVVDGEQNDGVSSAHKLEEEVTALPEIPGHHEAVP